VEEGDPSSTNPNVRVYDFNGPIGDGGFGGTQTQVRVSLDTKRAIQGTPWGPVTM
jgi:hypothetical protein